MNNDYIVEVCPKCGSKIFNLCYPTYPPKQHKECSNPKCDWSWTEPLRKMVEVPFDENKYGNDIDQDEQGKTMNNVPEMCANCKYWNPYDDNYDPSKIAEGDCHRYPTFVLTFDNVEKMCDGVVSIKDVMLLLDRNTPLMSHPCVYDEDWCGEFVAMDNPRFVFED